MMLEHYDSVVGVNMMRKHLGWYTRGLHGSAEFRNRVNQVPDANDRTRHDPRILCAVAEPRGGVSDDVAQPAPVEVLAALPVAVLLIGPDDRVWNANAAAETLFNRSQTAMHGRAVADIVPIPGDLADRGGRGRDHGLWAYDLDLAMPHGRFRVDLVEAPIADQPGWRLLTVHNLSSPHRTGHGAERSGGSLAAVGAAAILAHEIKNPLSGIRGAAQLLGQTEGELDADARALTGLITREVDRIAALIDGMQRFGDARPLPLAPANIYPMLEHARDLAKAGFAARIRIKEDYDPSLPDSAGPPRQLRPGDDEPAQERQRST